MTPARAKLPPVAVGCAAMGVKTSETGDERIVALLREAHALGARMFDVAPLYGMGRAEVLLGRAIAEMDPAPFISTKVGYVLNGAYGERLPVEQRRRDYSPVAIASSIEESLRRLGLARLDLVLLHDPDDAIDSACTGAYPVLRAMQRAGRIGLIGAGVNRVETALRLLDRLPLDAILVAGRHTLLDRSAAGALLPRCERGGTSLLVGGLFNSGLLANPSAKATFDYAPVDRTRLAKALQLEQICARRGVSLKAAALQFAARTSAVSTVVIGPRTSAELRECMTLLRDPLPDALWSELDAIATT